MTHTINSHFDGHVTSDEMHIIDRYSEMQTRIWINWARHDITQEVAQAFLQSVCDHIMYVRIAGRELRVDEHQLRWHDHTKLGVEEFPYYARQFHGDKADPNGFAEAWLHHIHHGEHHWQHWIFPDGFTPKGSTVENGVLRMDEKWLREMVADWMGASMAYTGSWDMTDWLKSNLPKIKLHSASWPTLKGILRDSNQGYHNVLNELQVNGLIP